MLWILGFRGSSIVHIVLVLSVFCRSIAIDQRTAVYDEGVAKKLLAMSAAAYPLSPDECIARTFPKEEEWQRALMPSGKCDLLGNLCSGFVAYSAKRQQMIVVFRGTHDKVQLLSEAYRSMRPKLQFYEMGKVNEYFSHGLDVLWPTIEPLLKSKQFQNFNIAFTGHSLGGALAALAAARTVVEGIRESDKIILYTFGEPRLGNPEFAANFNRLVPTSFRIVNGEDIVPHVPPCSENFFGQDSKPCDPMNEDSPYHHGVEIWYPTGMTQSNYIECRGAPYGEDFSCSDRVKFHVFKMAEYFDEHRHYFGRKVPAFGKLGCVIGDPREETLPNDAVTGDDWKPPSNEDGNGFGSILKHVKSFGQLIGVAN